MKSGTVRPGQFVVGSFCLSDNTCPHCKFGFHSSCVQREFMTGAQAPYARVPLADGTLVATTEVPEKDLVPHLLATSDVLGTGWYAADAANVRPGSTVTVVGDGAVGLMGVLAAKEMGAERIIAMSRHNSRQELAREFGATDIVAERGGAGIERVKELTRGSGRTPFWNASALRNPWLKPLIPCVPAARSVMSGYLMASPSTVRRCSSRNVECWADRPRSVASCPI